MLFWLAFFIMAYSSKVLSQYKIGIVVLVILLPVCIIAFFAIQYFAPMREVSPLGFYTLPKKKSYRNKRS